MKFFKWLFESKPQESTQCTANAYIANLRHNVKRAEEAKLREAEEWYKSIEDEYLQCQLNYIEEMSKKGYTSCSFLYNHDLTKNGYTFVPKFYMKLASYGLKVDYNEADRTIYKISW